MLGGQPRLHQHGLAGDVADDVHHPPEPADGRPEQFPSTTNGCDNQRFLVRWRSVSSDADVAARWNQSDVKFGTPTVGEGGWFDLDGCAWPEVRLENAKPGGSTLTDVAVRVQRWIPAP